MNSQSPDDLPTIHYREKPTGLIRVFAAPGSGRGGNPAPVWLDADELDTHQMQALAHASGHESAFVLSPRFARNNYQMRYFVPAHEMEMCGHATVAALWLLHRQGAWDGADVTIETASGLVRGRMVDDMVEISQPGAKTDLVEAELMQEIARCLRVDSGDMVFPVMNAATSRVKTLVGLASAGVLHALKPALEQVEWLCQRLGSTGLYPYAIEQRTGQGPIAHARQFPKSSGYPEDPATGIAAAALAWGLRAQGMAPNEETLVTVHQGEAMGSPSSIFVRLPDSKALEQICWLRGDAHPMEHDDVDRS
jgi:trans-2,3-dihydro-3-hydroxyanthranilate isomerase